LPYNIPRVLTIAGSDSVGGAGIQADLKTFAALGVHGLVALTAVTAQNTVEVMGIHEIPPEMVRLQIDAVVKDVGVKVAKTGMLSSSPIIREVARAVKYYKLRLVVDPVMVTKSGTNLLQHEALGSLIKDLLPVAEVVTPNMDEAEALTGLKITNVKDSIRAGEIILDLGPKAVVVKGGHLRGEAVDVLCQKNKSPKEFSADRIESLTTHGTGCTFSSAIAAFLAMDRSIEDAVKGAKEFVTGAIMYGLKIGKGIGPVDPLSNLRIDAERYKVISRMYDAISVIESSEVLSLLSPECQINIVMALPKPYSKGTESVCGIPGRIINVGGRLKAASCPAFGASKHIANVVLTAMEFDPQVRSAMNILYSQEIIVICRSLGFKIGFYDRKKEPEEVKSKEGATIAWGVRQAIKVLGAVPDIIYHEGDLGKEPMITVLGRDPLEVLMLAIKIGKKLDAVGTSQKR
jgi:hydroxymethylpyrimidine kinase/phosphomethylpyrimidine kinase